MNRSARAATVLAVFALVGTMAACRSDDDSSSSSETTEAAVATTITTVPPETTAPAGALTLTADVTDGLIDQQTVTVMGAGFDPEARVVQCDLEDLRVCWAGANIVFGTFASGTATIDVRRIIPHDPEVDCAAEVGRCVLRLAIGEDIGLVPGAPLITLTFDPDSPQRSAVDLTVTPSTALVDGQEVAIEVANLVGDAVEGLSIRVCDAAETGPCVEVPEGEAEPSGGAIVVPYVITRVLVDPAGQFEDVDCGLTRCVVRVSYPGSPSAQVELAFDPAQLVPDDPTLELVPTADPRSFQVLGASLAPGSGLTVVVCVQGQEACIVQPEPIITTDAEGAIDVVLTLPAQAEGIDCNPGTCAFSLASADPAIYLAPVFAGT